ncbi:protein SDA1-like protein [Dinothrombium tinctorium]|uniref:Protein SDA1 n=1 Tax=Dinothrombium tinctorium TaxID=1965070 RepID=A0A3S3SFM0_9ACAR|nr:protein SDA1-like protein [Dinothrombium tinctorium]
MGKRTNNQIPNNLPQLQNCIKRDPLSYKEEFIQQHTHFKALLQVFQLNPNSKSKNFEDLVLFLAQVSHCYPEELKQFPSELMNILKLYSTVLNSDTRLALCKALILLRNKSLLTPTDLLSLFFDLFKCEDKNLRQFLKNHIIADIKNINSKHKDAKLNAALQSFMFSMLNENNVIAAKIAIEILVELYHKNVWKDAKTVNMIANCCFSRMTKIFVTAIKFFLGRDEDEDNSSDDDSEPEDQKTVQEISMANRFNKKSRKRKRVLEKTKKVVKKSKKTEKALHYDFSAIHLLHDPQGMAEKLLRLLEKLNEKFEIKLMVIDLISRLIGIHQLFVFNFYSLIQRFLRPHQREVTKILLFAAQAAHELIPPEVLEPLLKTIADNFVSEHNSAECITVGLNAIRELCSRCPLVMNEDLLQDLALYKNYKNKNVSMAAKSIIQLYRVINPSLLKKKDRAKPTEASKELTVKQYGELAAIDYVPGAECLNEEENESEQEESEEEKSDSDEWVDINSDEEEIDIESDDESKMEIEKEYEEDITENKEERNEDKVKKATFISSSRILSASEFKRIRTAQLAKQVRAAQPKRFNKKDKELVNVDEMDNAGKGELVKLEAIERLYKKPRPDKESRLSTVMEGRSGREKFGKRKGKMNEFASKTEKERKKKKNFTMIKHKLQQKKKRSFQEKRRALQTALIKQMKRKK